MGDVQGRGGRIRRAELIGAGGMAFAVVVPALGYGLKSGLPWWAVTGATLVTAGFGGWAGMRIGRRRGVRDEILEPGERVLGTYTVRPPYTEHVPPSAHEGPQYQLRVTTQGMQMWERSALLWRYPWPELRVVVDGPRLRVHHGDREAGTMLLEQPGAVQEIRLVARRFGAS